mgnify:FL=1
MEVKNFRILLVCNGRYLLLDERVRVDRLTCEVSQGRVLKPTREQRAVSRKAGRAAYKTKVAECKRSTSTPAATLATPSQNSLPGEEKRSTQDFSIILSESSSDKANSSSSSLSPPDWVLVSRSKAKKAFAGRISKRAFTRSNIERAVSRLRALERAAADSKPLSTIQQSFPPRDRPESPDPINTI